MDDNNNNTYIITIEDSGVEPVDENAVNGNTTYQELTLTLKDTTTPTDPITSKTVCYDDFSHLLLPPSTPPTPQNVPSASSPRIIRVLIIGYYYRNNIGIDQYIDVFKYILQPTPDIKYKIKFVNCNKLTEIFIRKTDIVFIGGGDVLNEYTLNIINTVFKEKENLIIAVSVGTPDLNVLVNTNKMNIIDYLFLQTKQEHDILKEFYPANKIAYLPDLSYFMSNIVVLNETLPKLQRFSFGSRHVIPTDPSVAFSFNDLRSVLKSFKQQYKRKIIGVCLNNTAFSKETGENYQLIVKEIALFVGGLLNEEYIVCFLPFDVCAQHNNDPLYSSLNVCVENTQSSSQNNDIVIHTNVCDEVRRIYSAEMAKNIVNIQHRLYSKETFEIFSYFDFAVTMGLHSTLFSIYNNIPFLPLYNCKNIRNLLIDINYPSFLSCDLDIILRNTSTMVNKLLSNKMLYLLKHGDFTKQLKKYLLNVCQEFHIELARSIPQLLDIIVNKRDKRDVLPPSNIQPLTLFQKDGEFNYSVDLNKKDNGALKEIVLFAKLKIKLNNYCGGADFRKAEDTEQQKCVVSIVSYYLTGGDLHSDFCDELIKEMFLSNNGGVKYNYINGWGAVIKKNLVRGGRLPIVLSNHVPVANKELGGGDKILSSIKDNPPVATSNRRIGFFTPKTKNLDKVKKLYLYEDAFSNRENNTPRFNIHYFNQENKNGERSSGWNYLYNELKKYHTDDIVAPLLDMYIERTFQQERKVLKAIGIIPYRKKWRGFIHHSINTVINITNTTNLLQIPEFVESLPFCECIYVFSKTLELQLRFELSKIGWENLPITSLIQPAEINGIVPFRYSAFLENGEKRIIQPKGELINTFTFYQLQLPSSIKLVSNKTVDRWRETVGIKKKPAVSLTKTVLLNVNNQRYYPTASVKNNILTGLQSTIYTKSNNWNKWFYSFFENLVDGVKKMNNLEGEEYNDLLSKNIVFLHLEDVSTINTIIECCVRNCPFIVNRHPAVVELVGDEYPLFYRIDSTESDLAYFFKINKQIEQMFKDSAIIYKAYKYLCSLDKTRFHIDTITGVNKPHGFPVRPFPYINHL